MPWPFDLAELERLYSSLSAGQRAELLECIFVAASIGEKAVEGVLETGLLTASVHDLMATRFEIE